MAPQAADAAAAEWLGRLSALLGGLQLGGQFELRHRVPVAIESALGEDGKVQFASGTELRVAVRRLDAGGSTKRFAVTLDPEPDGFLTLTSGFGRLLAAPRLDKLIATLSLTAAAAGRAGALPTLKIEKLELAWRPENWRQSATQRLGGTSRVEQTVASTLENAAQELNDLATRVSAVIIRQVSGPELVRVAETANRGLQRVAEGSTTRVLNDLLIALGLGESAIAPTTACAAADWLSGFREFRCTVWLTNPVQSLVSSGSESATLDLVVPMAIDVVVAHNTARRDVSLVLRDRSVATQAPPDCVPCRGPVRGTFRDAGLYLTSTAGTVRVERLVFEQPLAKIGSGRFTEIDLEFVRGDAPAMTAVALVERLIDRRPDVVGDLKRREILDELNRDVPQVSAFLDRLLEQAARQLPPQAQDWLATARGALSNDGACPPRSTVIASAH